MNKSTLLVLLTCCVTLSAQALDNAPKPNSNTSFGAPVTQGEGELIEAKVVDVCRNKGCWMKVKTPTEERLVRFKDYGFFVPKDIKGQKIRMRVTSVSKTMSEEEQKHMLKESGASQHELALIKGSKTQQEWLATGVEILNP